MTDADNHRTPPPADATDGEALSADLQRVADQLRRDGAAWRDETEPDTSRIEAGVVASANALAGEDAPAPARHDIAAPLAHATGAPPSGVPTSRPEARSLRPPLGLAAVAAMLGVVLLLGLILRGALGSVRTERTLDSWQRLSAPTDEQFASYAVSPDVPGLVVACIGDQTPHVSAGQMGPAHIWRSRDGGQHWQQLGATGFYANCRVAMPAGGRGTVVAVNFFGGLGFAAVSHDAGDTWKTVASDHSLTADTVGNIFDALSSGTYRNGRLYAFDPLISSIMNPRAAEEARLAYTPDDGATWIPLESAPDPLVTQGYAPLGLAADYRSADAWFRVLAPAPSPFGSANTGSTSTAAPKQAVVQHSTDGGHTWTTLGPVGPAGSLAYALAYEGGVSATLATTSDHPSRVCAAFEPGEIQTASAGAGHAAGASVAASGLSLPRASAYGPPYTPQRDVALYASDDGGRTWHGATVAQRTAATLAQPGVVADRRGDCFIAANKSLSYSSSDIGTTIWELSAADSAAMPTTAATITDHIVISLAASPSADSAQPAHVLITVQTPQPPTICQGDVCPPYTPNPARLIGRTLP